MKTRYKIMAAIITLVMVTTIIIFSINLAKAKHVYEENILYASPEMEVGVLGNNLILSYVKGNNIIVETRTFSDMVLDEKVVETNSPQNLRMIINNNIIYIIWETEGTIELYISQNEAKRIIASEGHSPDIFCIDNYMFLTWIQGGSLVGKPIDQEVLWTISTYVSDYSIYTKDSKAYVAFTDSVIGYRRFQDGVWTPEIEIAAGVTPHTIISGENVYIYHKNDDGKMDCYYGFDENIKLVEKITDTEINDIYTNEDIVVFGDSNGVYFQRIEETGFSDTIFISNKDSIGLKCLYVDEDDVIFLYNTGGTYVYKMKHIPEITNEQVKPIKMEIDPTAEEAFERSAFDYIGDYNTRVLGDEEHIGGIRNYILAHSGESLVFLGIFIIGIVVTVTVVMGRRRDKKYA